MVVAVLPNGPVRLSGRLIVASAVFNEGNYSERQKGEASGYDDAVMNDDNAYKHAHEP